MKTLIAGILLLCASLATADEKMTAAVNEFGFALFNKVPDSKNRLISPLSLYTAFSMTVPGANGQTRAEIAQVLDCGSNEELGANIGTVLKSLDKSGKSLSLVNAAWLQKNFKINPAFTQSLAKFWKTAFYPADFIKSFEKYRKEINGFTEKKSAGMIKNLLPKGALNEQTRLVLLNALYFKEKWDIKFDAKNSYKAEFTGIKNKESVTFMQNKGDYGYFECDEYSAVELPYKDKAFSMLVLMPTDPNHFSSLLDNLNGKLAARLRSETNIRPVEIHLPRFAFKADYELVQPLTELGIKDAFGMQADFSGIEPTRQLFISKVFHGTGIEVDESGTTSAAATAVVISRKSLPPPSVVFKADRPFCFLIRHNETGLLLFIGEVKQVKI